MQKITPFLWFNDNAEDAVNYYLSVFKNSKLESTSYYGEGTPMPKGSVMTIAFEIEGQEFTALNGGPVFEFSQAVSFVVNCETQEEVDELWEKLTADGGEEQQCGWLKDKFGITWQIVPIELGKYIGSSDSAKAQRAVEAMLKMKKLDINVLKKAYDNE